MRILIQRVKRASVTISGKIKSKIDTGLLILVGIEEADTKEDAEWLAKKRHPYVFSMMKTAL